MFAWLNKFNPIDIRKKRDAYQQLAKTPHGKLIFKDLLNASGIYRTGINGDLSSMGRQQGHRDIGLHILRMLNMTDEEVNNFLNQLNEEVK